MAGENCVLSASGYGTWRAKCLGFAHGLTIVQGAPDETRNARAFYFSRRAEDRFGLTLVFSSWGDYRAFGDWIRGYGIQASTPGTPVGSMRVMVPSRGFDKVGVPSRGTVFSAEVGTIAYRMVLTFVGARETADSAPPSVSKFMASTDPDSIYFYPAGKQLKAGEAVENNLYNAPAPWSDDLAINDGPAHPPRGIS